MDWLYRSSQPKKSSAGRCGACQYFRDDPAYLEAAFKGMTSFGSAYASVRGNDGLCLRHDRYLGAKSFCADFALAKSAS